MTGAGVIGTGVTGSGMTGSGGTGGGGTAADPAHTVVLAGGQGTRFWPVSRAARPKQFLSIHPSGESLIQATARRVAPLTAASGLWVVTNDVQSALTARHLPSARVLCEPFGRNTAASIGLAALHVRREVGGDPAMLVLPADHSVADEEEFRRVVSRAVAAARSDDSLVTIGILPTEPNTGYGYIRRGEGLGDERYRVARFFEKPSLDRAKAYLRSGDYFWNSGMFAWRASVILGAIAEFLPALSSGLDEIDRALGTPDERRVTAEVFGRAESISIDFGVLEHARNCVVVTGGDFGWSDVGAWDAWARHFTHDERGNLLRGDTVVIDSDGCVVHSEGKLTAVVGGRDLVVIDSGDALLVCPRDRVQDVREVVKELVRSGRTELV